MLSNVELKLLYEVLTESRSRYAFIGNMQTTDRDGRMLSSMKCEVIDKVLAEMTAKTVDGDGTAEEIEQAKAAHPSSSPPREVHASSSPHVKVVAP